MARRLLESNSREIILKRTHRHHYHHHHHIIIIIYMIISCYNKPNEIICHSTLGSFFTRKKSDCEISKSIIEFVLIQL